MTQPWKALGDLLRTLGRKEPLIAALVAVVITVAYAVTQHVSLGQAIVVGAVAVIMFAIGAAAYIRLRAPAGQRPAQSAFTGLVSLFGGVAQRMRGTGVQRAFGGLFNIGGKIEQEQGDDPDRPGSRRR